MKTASGAAGGRTARHFFLFGGGDNDTRPRLRESLVINDFVWQSTRLYAGECVEARALVKVGEHIAGN